MLPAFICGLCHARDERISISAIAFCRYSEKPNGVLSERISCSFGTRPSIGRRETTANGFWSVPCRIGYERHERVVPDTVWPSGKRERVNHPGIPMRTHLVRASPVCCLSKFHSAQPSRQTVALQEYNNKLSMIRNVGGSLEDANSVVSDMSTAGIAPNSMTYLHLIAICGRSRCSIQAAQLMQCMRDEHIPVTVTTYSTFLATCARSNDTERARSAWNAMLEEGIIPNSRACGAYVDCLARAGLGVEARSILRDFPVGDTLISRTSIVSGLARCGKANEAIEEINDMISDGFIVNARSYTAICHCLGKQRRSDDAMRLLQQALEQRVQVDEMLFESVICACGATGDVGNAFAVVRMMKKQRLELSDRGFEGLIHACCSAGNLHRALILYDAAKCSQRDTARILSATASAILRKMALDIRSREVLNRMQQYADTRNDNKMRGDGVNPQSFRKKLRNLQRLFKLRAKNNGR